jgi:hypothetical protein
MSSTCRAAWYSSIAAPLTTWPPTESNAVASRLGHG